MSLNFKVREKGTELERSIREIDKSDHETILWTFSQILSLHRSMGKPEPPLSTVELFRQPERVSWLVDDVGLIFAVFDRPGRASVHIVFWDRRLRGREILCRGLADWMIHKWDLNYLCTSIPATSRATLAFAEKIGFEEVTRDLNGMVHLVYTTEVVSP
jgi:hypothetical protein